MSGPGRDSVGLMADPSGTEQQMASGVPLIGGLYAVDVAQPRPRFGAGLAAYVAIDRKSGRDDFMAVQVRADAPARAQALNVLMIGAMDSVLLPLAHGRGLDAQGQPARFVICPAPPGPPLIDFGGVATKPWSEADLLDPVKRGFYLVTAAHCMECHTPLVNGRHDFAQLGKGGQIFKGPFGVSSSRNITSHATAGLGAWSDVEIKGAITQGVRKDGTKLKPPMAFHSYARMTAQDLSAVVAYLRTLPPQE